MELDDRLTLPSAEGIDLDLVLAGIGSRGAAFLLDLLLQFVLLLLLGLAGAAFDGLGLAFLAIGSFLVLLGYPIVLEAFASGQTLGKRALRIAVVASDGTPVRFLGAVIRNVVRPVDALPGVYLVGLVSILATKRAQRVGDLAAGTLVVHTARKQVAAGQLDGFASGSGHPALPPEAAGWDVSTVTQEELAAVRSFLARRHQLDPVHRANLAQALAFQLLPKVAGVPLDGGPEAFLDRVAAAKAGR
ncbi:RDD family protein [Aquihabitans sp. G128]|uniref:RDD family protein n=1 Tax=Aquihabitans sp. G128 TaxID=2849779 RepID=UPI001C225FAF|nr:RDD family protein [Aquihabitans sp. G128]QXC61388.1 RDD family protein [Aquihabitans sp. G128]